MPHDALEELGDGDKVTVVDAERDTDAEPDTDAEVDRDTEEDIKLADPYADGVQVRVEELEIEREAEGVLVAVSDSELNPDCTTTAMQAMQRQRRRIWVK